MRTEPFTPKKKPKKEVDHFWKHQTSNSRLRHSIGQFDSLPQKMTRYAFSSVPCRACRACPRSRSSGSETMRNRVKAVPWHQGRPSITVIRPQKALQLETLLGGLGGTPSRRRQHKHSPRTSSLSAESHRAAQCVCFITAGPITKLCAWGEEESGGHVL